MTSPADITQWVNQLLTRIANDVQDPLPTETILAFDAPLIAYDDPSNGRIRVKVPTTLTPNVTASNGTTTLTNTADFLQPFDCTGGSAILTMPVGVTGQRCFAVDVSGATSPTKTVTFTSSTSTVKMQHPDTLALSASITFTSQRNFTFMKVSSTVLGDFWAAT